MNQTTINSIIIKNFRSYELARVDSLNKNINIIVGKNGDGKSNFFKALSFLFFEKNDVNHLQFDRYIHRGANELLSDQILIALELHFHSKKEEAETKIIAVAKRWNDTLEQELVIDQKVISKKEFLNFIQDMSLVPENPYNVIEQGKVNQITNLNQFELFELLQQSSGIQKFMDKKNQCFAKINKAEKERSRAVKGLQEIEEKIKFFQGRKEQYEYFSVQQKHKKYRQKKMLEETLSITSDKLQSIKEDYIKLLKQIEDRQFHIKSLKEEHDELNFKLNLIKEKKQELKKIDNNTELASIQQTYIKTQDLQILEKAKKQVEKQEKKKSKELKQKQQEIDEFRRAFQELEHKYEDVKMEKQIENKKGSEDKVINSFQEQIKNQEGYLKEMEQKKIKIKQELKQLKKFPINEETVEKYENSRQAIKQIQTAAEQNTKERNVANWCFNSMKNQYEALKDSLIQPRIKLKKILPQLNLKLLQEINKKKINGVYGYLIDFVNIHNNLMFAYELVGEKALCSLLVEDMDALIDVIQLNKTLKGGEVNIIKLSDTRQWPLGKKSLPRSVQSLDNEKWIKITPPDNSPHTFIPDIKKVINHYFHQYALVPDYETALGTSKSHGVNCITPEKQIVYAQAIVCRLGKEEVKFKNKFESYFKLQEKQNSIHEKEMKLNEISQKLQHIGNQELNLLNTLNEKEKLLKSLESDYEKMKMNKDIISILENDLVKTNHQLEEGNEQIRKKEDFLTNMKKKQFKFSPSQKKEIQTEYREKEMKLTQLLRECSEINEDYENLKIEGKILIDQIEEQHTLEPLKNEYDFIKNMSTSSDLEREQAEDEEKVQFIQNKLIDLKNEENLLNNDKNQLSTKLNVYEEEQLNIKEQIKNLGDVGEAPEDLDVSNSLSCSMSLSKTKPKGVFSIKQKVYFSRFASLVREYEGLKEEEKRCEKASEKIHNYLETIEKESGNAMKDLETKFIHEFTHIFKSFCPDGNCQVRFKNLSNDSDRHKGKVKRCLAIKLNLDDEEHNLINWNNFSGGEKTVVAICILMALQKCEPAPFYIFDEIDAALDSRYVAKLARIIYQQSVETGSQYFITSFKQEITSIPEENCNYYKIRNTNRRSTIEIINQEEARDFLSESAQQ